MDAMIFLIPVLLIIGYVECSPGRYCNIYDNYGVMTYSFCNHGCCSHSCCDKDHELHGGAIAGIVIGCVLGAVILVVVLVICGIILCKKNPGHSGTVHVMQHNPAMVVTPYPNVHYVRSSFATPPYGFAMQPSAPENPTAVPGESNVTDPPTYNTYNEAQHMKI